MFREWIRARPYVEDEISNPVTKSGLQNDVQKECG
jgi:hypothetical protein